MIYNLLVPTIKNEHNIFACGALDSRSARHGRYIRRPLPHPTKRGATFPTPSSLMLNATRFMASSAHMKYIRTYDGNCCVRRSVPHSGPGMPTRRAHGVTTYKAMIKMDNGCKKKNGNVSKT